MKVYIVGVDVGRPSGLLASPYMEKELHALGYEVEQFPAKDAGSLRRSFQVCAQPQALILVPLTGNVQADAACVRDAAELCGKPLVKNEEVAENICKRAKISEEDAIKLSVLPQDARIFPCRQSAIPGFEVAGDDFHVIVLPSDPEEQTSLFFSYLFQILSKTSPVPCHSRVLRVMEMDLDAACSALKDLLEAETPCVAIYEKKAELIIRISDNDTDRQKAAENCNNAMRTIVQRLGTHVYGIDVNGIEHALALKCAKKNIRIAFAESGSAGLAAKRFGKVDQDGQLVYSMYSCQPEEMDLEKLGINDKIGKKFGPVSSNVAAAMALGCSKQEEKDLLGLGITLPNAAFKTRKAYIAAVLNGVCMMQELDAGSYHSLTQMTSDAVARLFNMARKLVDSYPQVPDGSCDAERAVLEGIEAIPQQTALATNGKGKKGKKNLPQSPAHPAPKAPKGFKGLLYRIFPNRDDSGFDKVRKILMWICVCVFIGSMTYLIDFGADSKKSQDNIANLQDQMAQAEKEVEEGKINASDIEGYPNDYLPKFHSFYQRNEDIKGWVKIDGTNVNFPVVQTSDNDYYHRLGFDKEYDYYGTPYIDYEVDVKKPSTNIIVYGHNIRNDGQMFNDLTKYKQLSYYKERPLVTFDSVYKTGTYKIFGAFIANTEPSHDNGNVFEYNHFVDAKDEQEFNAFVDEVRRRSIFDTPVDVKYGDELLTLSTCTYEFKEARFVLVARRVRDGEDEKVDVSQAVANDDAYYPAIYAGAADYAKKLGKVKSIQIQGKRELSMEVGQTTTLTAQVSPTDAPIKTCSWDSSNTAVATVDKNTGLVTAVGAGTTKITAAADDGGFVDNITITVKSNGKELTGLNLSSTALTLKSTQTATITASAEPKEAQASLSWKSSDESIIRVTGNEGTAQLTAVNPGVADIIVVTSDGKLSAACKVTVTANDAGENNPAILFAQSSMSVTVEQLQNIQLTVTPANADVGTISWEASSDVISMKPGYTGRDADVVGMKPGQAVLTATTSTGLKASCTITVKEEDTSSTDKVKLSISPLVLNPTEEGQLRYVVEPSGTKLVWSSSDPDIVKVDQNGYVTTTASLEQTTDVLVTATTADGSVSAKTLVTVVGVPGSTANTPKPPETNGGKDENKNQGVEADLDLHASGTEVGVGYDKELDIRIGLAENEVSIKFTSSDNSVVKVDSNGFVHGVSSGTANITITAVNKTTGEYQTVTVPVTVTGSYGTSDDPTPDEDDDKSEDGKTTGGIQTGGFGTSD